MKQITNWRNATVADTEADGLLREATKLHVLSYKLEGKDVGSLSGDELERWHKFFSYHIKNGIPLVGHNFICFDVPLWEKLLGVDLSELMVIDTLALSWYLNVDRSQHGLDSFFEDYGIKKPKVDDWENLSYEEYKHRCEEDVKINVALWEDFKARLIDMYTKSKEVIDAGLVGGKRVSPDEVLYIDRFVGTTSVDQHIDRLLTFLMFKMDTVRLREKTRLLVDTELLRESLEEVKDKVEYAKKTLQSIMPPVPKYSTKKKPKKPYLKDGVTLSASGKSWNEAIAQIGSEDAYGNPIIKYEEGKPDELKILKKYDEPNAGSSQQIKDLLFSRGWVPETFNEVRDQDAMDAWFAGGCRGDKPVPRKVPQISKDGKEGKELCKSVVKLIEDNPELEAYDKFTLLEHRLSVFEGFTKSIEDGEYIKASIQGFTNTLRDRHRKPIANLPSVKKPYGKNIRGCLIAGEGNVACGTDLSGLEDRTKHHFMLAHDPDYVETMMDDDYDAHIAMALTAGMITQQEADEYLSGVKKPHVEVARAKGKTTNYASVYLAQPPTIAKAAGVPLAEGKVLFNAYWELNWSVKAIAEEQVVITDSRGTNWLVNPVNGFCYHLKVEKDRFSTLCQGTGSFFFDMWLDNIFRRQVDTYGVSFSSLQVHDEVMLVVNDSEVDRGTITKVIEDALGDVNKEFMLRRKLGCDIQFGSSYADIH